MDLLARYRKGIIAVLTAIVTVGAQLPPDAPSWVSRAAALAGALLVVLVPNAPQLRTGRIAKAP